MCFVAFRMVWFVPDTDGLVLDTVLVFINNVKLDETEIKLDYLTFC
jgi:hypothetical protein